MRKIVIGGIWVLLAVGVVARTVGQAGAPLLSSRERARVVIVEEPRAIQLFEPRPEVVLEMVRRGLLAVTGRPTESEAWFSLVGPEDQLGIKVHSAPGPTAGSRPAVVEGVVRSLLSCGFPADQIWIWDKQMAHLRAAGFVELAERLGVRVAASAESGYDETVFYEVPLIGRLVWGDLEFGKPGHGTGRKSHVTKLLTERLTKIIQVTPLLNHNLAGVSGNLYGLANSAVDNVLRFEFSTERLATAIPELYAMPELGDRVVLNIVDALICQYQGEERPLLHYSTALGQLRFSRDPVALDVLSLHELHRQRHRAGVLMATNHFLPIYTNASLLEIGISDLRKMDLLLLRGDGGEAVRR